jgi:tryptophan halogenase
VSAPPPVRVVVAGGGTAGWIAATALTRQLGPLVAVTLVESEAIGTVGVGESTIPTAHSFHELLRIDERAFMAATKAVFKLGISFEDWARIGDRYIHSFGTMGMRTWVAEFQHFWLEARAQGDVEPIGAYSLEHEAADQGRFAKDPAHPLNYAYHLDSGLYAQFLRRIAETDGATRVEGKIARVEQDGESGDVTALVLEGGDRLEGDLFIDCTGFRGLLIEQTLKAGFDDWTHWLPTDSAVVMQSAHVGEVVPYTRAIALTAGWRWRIPLQHRVGNGHVFCSEHMSDDEAREILLASAEGEVLTEPRVIRYAAGTRRQVWKNNVIAMGLSSGFVEPLESTSIHLFMSAATRLIQQFPFGPITPAQRARFNRMADAEIDGVRDFVILHYKLTERNDSPFWRRMRTMAIPDTLAERIALFAERAEAWQAADELYRVDSWAQVMLGQRLTPQNWHRMGAIMSEGRLRQTLEDLRTRIVVAVEKMSTHQQFLDAYCGRGSESAKTRPS